jgi:hypothetical protein
MMRGAPLPLFLLLLVLLPLPPSSPMHISSGVSKVVSDYRVYFATYPSPSTVGNVTLIFSVQYLNGTDARNISASVDIYRRELLIHTYPRSIYRYGDFTLQYFFDEAGAYLVRLTIYQPPGEPVSVDFNLQLYEQSFLLFTRLIAPAIVPATIGALLAIILILSRRRGTGECEKADVSTPAS